VTSLAAESNPDESSLSCDDDLGRTYVTEDFQSSTPQQPEKPAQSLSTCRAAGPSQVGSYYYSNSKLYANYNT